MSTILVTGARGTVGTYTVGLAEAAGHRVIVSDLDSRGLRAPVRGEIRPADLRDPAVYDALVRGVDVVVNAAAERSVGASAEELSRVNTESVARLFEASARAKVKRFIHISSATNYQLPTSGPVREDTPIAPRGPLGISRHAAEVYLHGRADGPAWTILRPAPIYGPRGRHFASSLLAFGPLVRLGGPFVLRPIGGPLGTMVHAEDVARAALFVMDNPASHRAVFNVADGDVMTLGERLAVTLDAYGIKSYSVGEKAGMVFRRSMKAFDKDLVHTFADASSVRLWSYVVARYGLKPALRPHLDREMMALLHEDLVVDAGALRALGYVPRHQRFEDGFRDVLRWYQAERWVPRYG